MDSKVFTNIDSAVIDEIIALMNLADNQIAPLSHQEISDSLENARNAVFMQTSSYGEDRMRNCVNTILQSKEADILEIPKAETIIVYVENDQNAPLLMNEMVILNEIFGDPASGPKDLWGIAMKSIEEPNTLTVKILAIDV